jgi:UDP-N-acetylmuramate dehydrogenase
MSDLSLPAARGQILCKESLTPLTWFRVGGPAEALFLPADEADLTDFLANLASDIPVTVLGVGSNVIVRDGGIEGVTIRLGGRAFAQIDADPAGGRLSVGAGALDAMAARAAAKVGIAGLEFLAGIPGAIGGALTMNAGCYGAETKDVLVQARGVDRGGAMLVFSNRDFGFSYRRNAIAEPIVWLEATFQGAPSTPDAVAARMAEITAQREASQPIREKTGGSTFKNPMTAAGERLSAWKLIDQAGMRGARRGGAQVSEKHANFLINTGAASAADIEGLGEDVRAAVHAKHGVELEWEIKRIGRG